MDNQTYDAIAALTASSLATTLLIPFAIAGRMPRREEWRSQIDAIDDRGIAVRVEELVEIALAAARDLKNSA